MEIINNLLFWLHLGALTLAGAAIFASPLVGSKLGSATAEMRPLLWGILGRLTMMGRGALVVLLITGPLMVWLKFGGAGLGPWFMAKMVFVLLLLVSVIVTGIMGKRSQRGDKQAIALMPKLGAANMLLALAIVFCAVFAFN
jgi:uncharacterized membrane protein